MNALNYIVLIIGLILISVFWFSICPRDRKRETVFVSIGMTILGIVVYFLQSTFA
jgi:RsiW-degrading membrane proteinase PrsW (M82 family)